MYSLWLSVATAEAHKTHKAANYADSASETGSYSTVTLFARFRGLSIDRPN
jgi:hypothetical protein